MTLHTATNYCSKQLVLLVFGSLATFMSQLSKQQPMITAWDMRWLPSSFNFLENQFRCFHDASRRWHKRHLINNDLCTLHATQRTDLTLARFSCIHGLKVFLALILINESVPCVCIHRRENLTILRNCSSSNLKCINSLRPRNDLRQLSLLLVFFSVSLCAAPGSRSLLLARPYRRISERRNVNIHAMGQK